MGGTNYRLGFFRVVPIFRKGGSPPPPPPPPVHINAFISPKPLLPTGYPIQAHCAILFISYLRAARKNTFSFALLIYPPYKLQSGHKNIKRHQWGKNDLNKQD
jgi:hypothetical protein